jgi:uncharacterized protein YlxW (UPF0749 family)
MKNRTLLSRLGIIAGWLFIIVGVYAADQNAKVDSTKADDHAAIVKERDDLKAQLATTQQQVGALQAQNQYLAVLAERNEMAVRLLQANARGDDLQKQLDAEKAKVADLEKKIAEPAKK